MAVYKRLFENIAVEQKVDSASVRFPVFYNIPVTLQLHI